MTSVKYIQQAQFQVNYQTPSEFIVYAWKFSLSISKLPCIGMQYSSFHQVLSFHQQISEVDIQSKFLFIYFDFIDCLKIARRRIDTWSHTKEHPCFETLEKSFDTFCMPTFKNGFSIFLSKFLWICSIYIPVMQSKVSPLLLPFRFSDANMSAHVLPVPLSHICLPEMAFLRVCASQILSFFSGRTKST